MKLYCPYCDEEIEIKIEISFYICPHCKNRLEKITKTSFLSKKTYDILEFSNKQDKICPDCQKGILTTKESYPFNSGVIYNCKNCKSIFYKSWLSKENFIILKL